MSRRTWVKDDLYITYGAGSLIAFEDDKKIQGMKNVMCLYYDIDIFNGKKNIFHAEAYGFPKVQNLPEYIDYIVQMKEEDMFTYEDYKDNGFHRKQLYSLIDVKDFCNIEYFYKIEKSILYVRQDDNLEYDKYEEYTLTIGQSTYGKCHGESIFIENLTKEDLLKLKQTAIGFCDSVIKEYNEYIEEEYLKCINQE